MTLLLFWIIGLAVPALLIYGAIRTFDEVLPICPLLVVMGVIWIPIWFAGYGLGGVQNSISYEIPATVTKGSRTVFVESAKKTLTFEDAATYLSADKIKGVKVTENTNIYGGNASSTYELVFE